MSSLIHPRLCLAGALEIGVPPTEKDLSRSTKFVRSALQGKAGHEIAFACRPLASRLLSLVFSFSDNFRSRWPTARPLFSDRPDQGTYRLSQRRLTCNLLLWNGADGAGGLCTSSSGIQRSSERHREAVSRTRSQHGLLPALAVCDTTQPTDSSLLTKQKAGAILSCLPHCILACACPSCRSLPSSQMRAQEAQHQISCISVLVLCQPVHVRPPACAPQACPPSRQIPGPFLATSCFASC